MCGVSEFKEKSDLINELLHKMDLDFEDDMTREEREALDVERQMLVLRIGWNKMSATELKELLVPKPVVKEKKPKPKCRKKDLISLIWPWNTCYSDLIVGIPKGVTVDTVAGIWTFQDQTYKIGDPDRCPCMDITGNPIGVYDRTKIKHLNQMKEDAEWVRTRFHSNDY